MSVTSLLKINPMMCKSHRHDFQINWKALHESRRKALPLTAEKTKKHLHIVTFQRHCFRRWRSLRTRKLFESAWTLPSSIVTFSIDFSEEKTLLLLPFLIEENFPSSSEKIRIRDVQAGKLCGEKSF